MNLGDFEPLHHLSLKAAMCFQAAMLAAISEKADAIRAVHVLSGIKDKSPETLEGFDLASAGIELKSTRIEWPETEGPVCGTVGYEAPLSDDLKKVLEAAKLTARKYRSGRIAPIHLLCGLAKSDSDLESKLAIAGATAERLDERCRYESRADEWRIPLTQTGIAYDLHRLVEGRKLILGGVELAFEKGPAGHSDGDVLSHAICDALLGAGGLGDIGTHFPDTDAKWKGASSLVFLEHARKLLDGRGCRIAHIDAVVITEKPKLTPYFPAMRTVLARALGIGVEQINLKAKTNEGVDAIGRGEAIAAHAVATIEC